MFNLKELTDNTQETRSSNKATGREASVLSECIVDRCFFHEIVAIDLTLCWKQYTERAGNNKLQCYKTRRKSNVRLNAF